MWDRRFRAVRSRREVDYLALSIREPLRQLIAKRPDTVRVIVYY